MASIFEVIKTLNISKELLLAHLSSLNISNIPEDQDSEVSPKLGAWWKYSNKTFEHLFLIRTILSKYSMMIENKSLYIDSFALWSLWFWDNSDSELKDVIVRKPIGVILSFS
jgi:hypothetical protein